MPRKNLFTRDMFINAAFRSSGRRATTSFSARSLARELGCSTMPVYSYLKSMKTLVNDLEEKAVDLMVTYQTTSSTGQPFLDMGHGYVLFARNEKNLFRFLFMGQDSSQRSSRTGRQQRRSEKDLLGLLFAGEGRDRRHSRDGKDPRIAAFNRLIAGMKTDPDLQGLDDKQLESILTKMWIFTHGLAYLANSNSLFRNDEEFINEAIYETGLFVIQGEMNRKKII